MTRTRLFIAFALIFSSISATAAAAQAVTMDRLWPNEDGRQWSYVQHYENLLPFSSVYDDQIRLVLDGPAFAPTAIVAQYLHHELLTPPSPALALAAGITDPFLQRVWLARPDLREKIREQAAGICPGNAPPGLYSILLNGEFAYRKTASEIAAWRCNLADTRAWQWLVSDLTIGNTFTLQLIPDFASDVFLHGRVAAVEPSNVPGGSFPGCVRVEYVIDYGNSICTDDNGSPTGTSRGETRGFVRYAPDVGPVESLEEFVPFVEVTGACGGAIVDAPYDRVTLQLASPSVAARPLTWGAVKLLYR